MKQEAKAAGATGWITKPFKPEQLLAVVSKAGAQLMATRSDRDLPPGSRELLDSLEAALLDLARTPQTTAT